MAERFAEVISRIIFCGLLAVMVLGAIPYGSVDPWWESAVVCGILALTALWIVEVLLRGSWQIRKLPVLLPMIAITAYIFLQAVQLPISFGGGGPIPRHSLSIDHYQTLMTARKSLALTLFLGLLLAHTTSNNRVKWIVRSVIGLGLASAVFGIVRQFLQLPDSTGGFILPFLFYGTGYGQFISTNAFAYLMEMTIGLLLGLIIGGGAGRNRVLMYLAILVVVFTALVLSNSRGGILGIVCQTIFLLFVSMSWYSARTVNQNRKIDQWLRVLRTSLLVRLGVILILIGALSLGILWIGGESLVSKIAGPNAPVAEQRLDGDTRKEIWRATWKLIKQNPWTGVGFGAYFLGIPQYQVSSGMIKVEQAHNDYLDLAASGGLIGVLLGAWFLGTLIWQARETFKVRDAYQRAAALGAAGAILSVCVHSVVDFGLQLTGLAVVFAALVVILVVNRKTKHIVAAK